MKSLYKLLGTIVLSVLILSNCNDNITDTPQVHKGQSSLMKKSGPSASGQGRIVGTDRTFTFSAVTHPDGSVSGEGQINNHNGTKIHFTINCLSVLGNVATLSGFVTNSDAFSDYVNGPCWFKVKDNGEGANANPDEITFFLFCTADETEPPCDELTCNVDHEDEVGGMNPIENGNIQVKP